MLCRKDHSKPVPRKTPKPCTVIALFETRALTEEIADAGDLQDNQDRESNCYNCKQTNHYQA